MKWVAVFMLFVVSQTVFAAKIGKNEGILFDGPISTGAPPIADGSGSGDTSGTVKECCYVQLNL